MKHKGAVSMQGLQLLKKLGAAFGICAILSGCLVTSGHLTTKTPECADVKSEPDFYGDKPQWNIFGEIKSIRRCRSSNQAMHTFLLTNGNAVSQITFSDEYLFREVTEQSFREALARIQEFQPIANSTDVIDLSNGTRRTFYAMKPGYKRPIGIFILNDGIPGHRPYTWTQFHFGQIKSPTPMSLADFEIWFVKKIRTFKSTGGDYTAAFNK